MFCMSPTWLSISCCILIMSASMAAYPKTGLFIMLIMPRGLPIWAMASTGESGISRVMVLAEMPATSRVKVFIFVKMIKKKQVRLNFKFLADSYEK